MSLNFHSAPMSPNNMIEDPSAVEPDHILTLEWALDYMRSDAAATCQLLQSIFQRLGPEPTAPISLTQQPVSH